jgi:CTD kinase subunit gamma
MNTRANIMYFIEHLCDLAQRENHPEYVRMMQRDILRVIDAVCPPDGSGSANIRVARRVLAGLQAKSVLLLETVSELDAVLKSREVAAHPFVDEGGEAGGNGVVVPGKRNGGPRLEKRQVEQRIEEDRERHKRLRENIWAVNHGPDGDGELEKLWDEASDIGEDDYLAGAEDQAERQEAIAFG